MRQKEKLLNMEDSHQPKQSDQERNKNYKNDQKKKNANSKDSHVALPRNLIEELKNKTNWDEFEGAYQWTYDEDNIRRVCERQQNMGFVGLFHHLQYGDWEEVVWGDDVWGLQQINEILEVPQNLQEERLPDESKNRNQEAEGESSDSANYDKKKIDAPYPPPLLPKEFKDKIREESEGEKVEKEFLVIQKRLTKTDVNRRYCYFTFSKNRVLNEFLHDHEEAELDKSKKGKLQHISVKFIEPNCKLNELRLKRRTIGENGLYVLGKKWNRVVKENNLTEGMIIQLWAARVRRELWLALVNLTGGGGNGTNNAGARNKRSKGSSSSSAPPSDH